MHAGLQVGDAVAHLSFGSFARWGIVMAKEAMPISRLEAPVLALLTSGLTASIGATSVLASIWLRNH